jgi:hypothetical protein
MPYVDTYLAFPVTPDRLYSVIVGALLYLGTYKIDYGSEKLRIVRASRIERAKYDNRIEFQVKAISANNSMLHLIVHDPDVMSASSCCLRDRPDGEYEYSHGREEISEYLTLGRFRHVLSSIHDPNYFVDKRNYCFVDKRNYLDNRHRDRLAQIAKEECATKGIKFQRLSTIQRLFVTHYRCHICRLMPVYFLRFLSNRARCSKCGQTVTFASRGRYGRIRKQIAIRIVDEIRPPPPR